ncbi:MAG: PGF-pre-PGF domain-containing protein [Candidatus Hadarchaeales archaeon]
MPKISWQLCVIVFLCYALTFSSEQVAGAENLYPHDFIGYTVTTIWFDRPVENAFNNYISYGREKPETIPPPPHVVFEYFEINVKENVSRAKVEFRVEREWLALHNIRENGVKLLKFAGNWIEIPVTLENIAEGYVYYSSDIFSFSIFAIVGLPEEGSRGEIHFAILITGILVVGVIYWFMVRPKKLFVSLRRLKKTVKGVEEPPPKREISLTIVHLKERTEELYRMKQKKERS